MSVFIKWRCALLAHMIALRFGFTQTYLDQYQYTFDRCAYTNPMTWAIMSGALFTVSPHTISDG